jgi:hypothetical protein
MSHPLPAIVYVHGISKHDPGYSDEWFAALKPHLTGTVEKFEVLWSDIVNAKAMMADADRATFAANLAAEESLRREVEAELESRKIRNRQTEHEDIPEVAKGICGGSGFALDDFARYMAWQATRESILSRFTEVVQPLLQEGRTIHIISHSWGTVVGYEGLRRLDNETFPGSVTNLFVLGSALSIGVVQRNLFGRVTDGRLPKCVKQFYNVDADGDIVGGLISPPFTVTEQFLDQYPTGCSIFPFRRRTARSFTCAHGSYFQPENTAVNRDIVAHYINQTNS